MRIAILFFGFILCFSCVMQAQKSFILLHDYSIYENFQSPVEYYKSKQIKEQKAVVIDAITNDTLFVNQSIFNQLGYRSEEFTYQKRKLVSHFQTTFDSNNRPKTIEHLKYSKPITMPIRQFKYDVDGQLLAVSICDSSQIRNTISFKYDTLDRCIYTQNASICRGQLVFRKKHIFKKNGLLEVIKTTYFPKSLPYKSKHYCLYNTDKKIVKQFVKKGGKEVVSYQNKYNNQNQLVEQWIPAGPPTTKYKATKFVLEYDANGLLIRRLAYEEGILKQLVIYEYTLYQ